MKDWVFQHFVDVLLSTTAFSGGRLTLEKNIRRGSLIEALNALATYLPDGFIPRSMPATTLQRLKDSNRVVAKAAKMILK